MPRVPLRLLLASGLFIALLSSRAFGQLLEPRSIQVQGTQYTADEIGGAAGVKAGQTYTADFLTQTAQTLMSTGLFAKVEFKFDGQDLVYMITDSPELYPVVIDNLPLPTGKDADAALRAQVPLYRGKVPGEGATLESVRKVLQAMLADEGIRSSVAAVPGGNEPGKKATSMKFRIDAPAVRVGAIQVQGIPPEIRTQIPEPDPIRRQDYSNDQSPTRIQRFYETAFASMGYAAATVQARREGDVLVTPDEIRVPFAVEITPGRVYQLGDVRLAPDVPATMAQLGPLTKPRSAYSPESGYAIAVRNALAVRLQGMGYLDSSVEAHAQLDEAAGKVSYTIDAVLGPVYHLAFVRFDNVSDQLRSLLMRNWQMLPGDPFNESYVANFILTAQKADPVLMRSLVGVKASYDVKIEPQTHDVNLTIRLER